LYAPLPLPETVKTVAVRPSQIFVQAGAFSRADNATRLKTRLDGYGSVRITGVQMNGVDLYRVRLGPLANVDEADQMLARVVAAGANEARIVVE
jgi:rare lipoprotein A